MEKATVNRSIEPVGNQTEQLADTWEAIGAVANHEIKSLFLAMLAREGPLPRDQMDQHLQDLAIDSGAMWVPNKALGSSYCQFTLEPAGLVVTDVTTLDSPQTTVFEVSPLGHRLGLPLAGLAMGLNLRHPDMSTQTLLGATQSRGTVRAPQARSEILFDLLTSPQADSGVGMFEIRGLDGLSGRGNTYRRRAIENAIKALDKNGYIRVERAIDDNNRHYRRADSWQEHRALSSPLSTQVMEYLAGLGEESTFTFEDCFEFIQADNPAHPSKLRRQLRAKLKQLPMVEEVSRYNRGYSTRVFIEPAHLEMVTELVMMINAVLDQDPAALQLGRQLAFSILEQPGAIRQLFDKAYQFSYVTQAVPLPQAIRHLRSLLQTAPGPLDIATIARLYNETSHRPISRKHVTNILKAMPDELEVSLAPNSSKSSRNIQHYSLKQPPEPYRHQAPETPEVRPLTDRQNVIFGVVRLHSCLFSTGFGGFFD